MYNGIGLNTARGSGTNGHVQRNWAFVRSGKNDNASYKTPDSMSQLDASINRPPNKEIIEHERKRQIEVKCLEFEEILEKQGNSEDVIKMKVDSYRTKLSNQQNNEIAKDEFGRVTVRETHQIAEAQQQKNDNLRNAFGISKYFVEGSSFDVDRKAKEELAKSIAIREEMKNKRQTDDKFKKKYALVLTPEKDDEDDVRVDKKKKRKHNESPPEKKNKKKKSKHHKKERKSKKVKRKHNESDTDSSSEDTDSSQSDRDIKKRKKSKKDKKADEPKRRRSSSNVSQSKSTDRKSKIDHYKPQKDSNSLRGRSRERNQDYSTNSTNHNTLRNVQESGYRKQREDRQLSPNEKQNSGNKMSLRRENDLGSDRTRLDKKSKLSPPKNMRIRSKSLRRSPKTKNEDRNRSRSPKKNYRRRSRTPKQKVSHSRSRSRSRSSRRQNIRLISRSKDYSSKRVIKSPEKSKTTIDIQRVADSSKGTGRNRSGSGRDDRRKRSVSRDFSSRYNRSVSPRKRVNASSRQDKEKSRRFSPGVSSRDKCKRISPSKKRRSSSSSDRDDAKISSAIQKPPKTQLSLSSSNQSNTKKESRERRRSPSTDKKKRQECRNSKSTERNGCYKYSGRKSNENSPSFNSRRSSLTNSKNNRSRSPVKGKKYSKNSQEKQVQQRSYTPSFSRSSSRKSPESVSPIKQKASKESSSSSSSTSSSNESDIKLKNEDKYISKRKEDKSLESSKSRHLQLNTERQKSNYQPSAPKQPIVYLQCDNDGEDDDGTNDSGAIRNTKRSRYVDDIDRDANEAIKELEMFEQLKTSLAAKAKQKIQTIEKLATEINEPNSIVAALTDSSLVDTIVAKVSTATVAAAEHLSSRRSRSRSRSRKISEGRDTHISNGDRKSSRSGSRSSNISTSSSSSSNSSLSSNSSGSSSVSSRSSSSSKSSGSSSSTQSSRASVSNSSPTHSRSSRSPSIPRRRGSPSFLDRRRITSARKRPIPYNRASPSSETSCSSFDSRASFSRPFRSTSRSRSPSNMC